MASVALSGEAAVVQVKFQRTGFLETIRLQVFEYIAVELKFADLRGPFPGDRELDTFEMEWVDPYQHDKIVELLSEILMNDIAALSHSFFI